MPDDIKEVEDKEVQTPETEDKSPDTQEGVVEDNAAETEDKSGKPSDDLKPTEEDTDKGDTSKVAEHDPAVWGERFNDDAIDSAVDLIRESGMKPEVAQKIFKEAAESGDLSKINEAALVEALGQSKANLVMIGVKDWFARSEAKAKETVQALHTQVGGEELWGVLAKWVREGGIKDEKLVDGYRNMIDQGGPQAAFAAQEIKKAYEDAHGTLDPSLLVGDGDNLRVDNSPISKKEYYEGMVEAEKTGNEALKAQLRARRAAGRAKGI